MLKTPTFMSPLTNSRHGLQSQQCTQVKNSKAQKSHIILFSTIQIFKVSPIWNDKLLISPLVFFLLPSSFFLLPSSFTYLPANPIPTLLIFFIFFFSFLCFHFLPDMGLLLHHRKFIKYSFNKTLTVPDICLSCNFSDNSTLCKSPCFNFCPFNCQYFLESPPPVFAYDIHANKSRKFLIIAVSVLSTTLFALLCYVIFAKFYLGWWSGSRRRSSQPQTANETRDDHFLDEDHGPLVDHHVWYINTVGLQPSIISEITVCKYKKGDGLVEGTDCSVCLNDFQEDETLRLLPKCSHAFHVSCIDTWLRSHTNCPLCRAPIVKIAATATSSESINENSDTAGNTQVGILVDNGETERELEEYRVVNVTEGRGELQLENTRKRSEISEEIQPIRRSVSLDCLSASKVIQALSNFAPEESIGNSDTQLAEVRDFHMKIVAKRIGRTESLRKFVGSSSMGRSLQKAPVSLKRSISCSGKFLFSRST